MQLVFYHGLRTCSEFFANTHQKPQSYKQQARSNLLKMQNETENSFVYRSINATHRCGNVYTNLEKISILVGAILTVAQPILVLIDVNIYVMNLNSFKLFLSNSTKDISTTNPKK